ncbi:MAG: amidohydrolase family protein [Novosphingobium sp.]|nr:amidohydrolase family protein [Novosphingobium sp.]
MLIRDAEVRGLGLADVRIANQLVAAIGRLAPLPGERILEARGGALLPGLHDHHIHLAGLAVRNASVVCGPPEVTDRDGLARRLSAPGQGWIRGILYHESVMGLPDARELDALVADRPLRMQHRGGRMWLLNSPALEELLSRAAPPQGLEKVGDRFTGRLFDEDQWLQRAMGSSPPDFSAISARLAARGVTGVTDMSPRNDPHIAGHFAEQMELGALVQRCTLAGNLALAEADPGPWVLGPAKLHLHETAFPDFDETVAFASSAHDQGRPVAVHCVTEAELVFALAVLEASGSMLGDRIEHVSVASPELVGRMAELSLHACVQPHFVAERGDSYLRDVEPRHHGDLYRLRTLLDNGIPLVGGSDAPFGGDDPWAAMAAAVHRNTNAGASINPSEALSSEEALSLYLKAPNDLSRERRIAIDQPADLCLLDRSWNAAASGLESVTVRATWVSGRLVHDGVDQAPVQRVPGAEPLA